MLQEVHLSRRGAQGPAPRGVRCPRRYLFIWGEGRAGGQETSQTPEENPTRAGLGPPGSLAACEPTADQPCLSVEECRRRGFATCGRVWLVHSAAPKAYPPSFVQMANPSRPRGPSRVRPAPPPALPCPACAHGPVTFLPAWGSRQAEGVGARPPKGWGHRAGTCGTTRPKAQQRGCKGKRC